MAQKFAHGQNRCLGKQSVSQNFEREEKIVCQFLTGYSFKGRRNLKTLRHTLVA